MNRDRWTGLVPERPPAELRARVLRAARYAAAHPADGLLEALYRDRLLRLCTAALTALVVANVWLARGGGPQPIAPPVAFSADGATIPEDGGLTAAEQADELGAALGEAVARGRG